MVSFVDSDVAGVAVVKADGETAAFPFGCGDPRLVSLISLPTSLLTATAFPFAEPVASAAGVPFPFAEAGVGVPALDLGPIGSTGTTGTTTGVCVVPEPTAFDTGAGTPTAG
jgi:hypothetical protein